MLIARLCFKRLIGARVGLQTLGDVHVGFQMAHARVGRANCGVWLLGERPHLAADFVPHLDVQPV